MTYYGLDDSQRPLNRNIAFLRENRINFLTLHLLYSGDDNLIKYIWTLSQPEKEHGKKIVEFLKENCHQGDIVYACPHYAMYPQLKYLDFISINGWAKHSPQSKLYSKADSNAKNLSAAIAEAIEKGRGLELYEEFYFGNRNSLLLLKNAPYGI
ncbi:MAG: hypothetical protein QXF12_03850 [Candidatus Aenigmatarchaeota archaeon]